jgi:hypothetical protein
MAKLYTLYDGQNTNIQISKYMSFTTESVIAGKTDQTLPEFGRVKDVEKLFGVKRGILYRWIGEGKVKSVCIREPGNIQGVRLIHLASVREYINSQMN